jgi:hypothetical protein
MSAQANTDQVNVEGPSLGQRWLGRTFLHPAIDYLLIGGGASLMVTLAILATGDTKLLPAAALHACVLFSNSAHFASSTVRLYRKPNAFSTWPAVTMLLPLATLVLLVGCLVFAAQLGRHATAIYLTWSPYHYAAQAYGLALMYAYRSGCKLGDVDKRWLRGVAMLPFVQALVVSRGVGIQWLLPASVTSTPGYLSFVAAARWAIPAVAAVAFGAMLVTIRRSTGRPLPLISGMVILSNGIWWFLLGPLDAFLWATIFHGLQYLVIVSIFHVRDRVKEPDARPPWQHALGFYGMSLALGYLLFQCLPLGFVTMGFGAVESVLLTVAAINIHHFLVDGFIWKLGRDARNRRIVRGEVAEATATPGQVGAA